VALRTHLTAGLPFSQRAWPTYLIISIVANSPTARKSCKENARRLAVSSPIYIRQALLCKSPSLYHNATITPCRSLTLPVFAARGLRSF
jgi:hypothetical protein